MGKNRTYAEWFSWMLGFSVFLELIFPKAIVLVLLGLLGFIIAGYVKRQLTFQWNAMMVFFILFYIAYAIGCFFTRHWDWATHYLESKLAFVLFPLLFMHRLKTAFSLRPLILGLVVANVVLVIIGLKTGLDHYAATHNALESFTSTYFSPVHHPTYFAAFNVITLSGCWYGYYQRWKGFNAYALAAFTVFSFVVHMMCLSLAGLLFITALTGVYILYLVARRFGKTVLIGTIVLVPVLLTGAFLSIPTVKTEVTDLAHSVSVYIRHPNLYVYDKPGYKTGGEVRLVMWTVGTMEFLQHPMGVGTGNVDEHLNYRLYRSNQQNLIPKNYNPHNQYIQTAVEIGVIGLFILVGILVSGIRFARKNGNWLLLISMACLAFNCLFESILQRNSGIIFFTFIPCLLVFYSNAGKAVSKPVSDVAA